MNAQQIQDIATAHSLSLPDPAEKKIVRSKSMSADARPWWTDPRWWAIIITNLLTIANFGMQWRLRMKDKRVDEISDDFDNNIRNPLQQTFSSLRQLASEVSCACDIIAIPERKNKITQIREQSAPKALTSFSMALLEAEKRTKLSNLVDIEADLEDVFYPELGKIPDCESANELRRYSRRISDKIIESITRCDELLRLEKPKYIKRTI